MKTLKSFSKIGVAVILLFTAVFGALVGCKDDDNPLDPNNPVTITLWHYYSGAIETAFESMIDEFNETKGKDSGVIVDSVSKSSVGGLETAIRNSANEEVGADPMPDIFASYADSAYEIEQKGLLADLGKYLTANEQKEYVTSFLEEGKIGLSGELRIFPIAKSSEVLMLNDTDWADFADECGYTYADLATYESIAAVSKAYYEWTDNKTPETANDGKAFFGRDSMANFFITAVKEFGAEIFSVADGQGTLNLSKTVMQKIWDYYYVPYISGYYYASGSFRSQDTTLGEILSYVGSTASANYAPTKVTIGGVEHAITPKMLPVPHFEGGANIQVQQGAGMVVTKSERKKEYASVLFLKWFTDINTNTVFSAMNGYIPVKKAANSYDSMMTIAEEKEINISPLMDETLRVLFGAMDNGAELYTNKAFSGGAEARKVLDAHLQAKAVTDRAEVIAQIASGKTHEQAVAAVNTPDAFNTWYTNFKTEIESKINK